MAFDYDLDYEKLDLRKNPELYRVGKGEQGVLLVEPYKSEILPHWRFKTPEIAQESCDKISDMFEEYRKQDDFVGMDMARKFIQMGYTRARRYTNYKGGRKYNEDRTIKERQIDPVKAESAAIFKKRWDEIREDEDYNRRKREHQHKYGELKSKNKKADQSMGENDFPKGVGKPATRALIGAGYTKVEQLKDATEKEILELHGVGPKAIKVLKQELASKGLEFKK
ncbi:DUF4385 family protein [Planomicrobium okeanokoites]|nr:DUF4385 family protein [Planomicrobium okeanokoites]